MINNLGPVVQLVRMPHLQCGGQRFESARVHHSTPLPLGDSLMVCNHLIYCIKIMTVPTNLIIDFDSTFVKLEALEELAEISLASNPAKEKILAEIKKITDLGMEGKITFPESLKRRFKLLSATKHHLEQLIKKIENNISDSVTRNRDFFIENGKNIYIITGGFKECIAPVTRNFGIREENILANEFVFDDEKNIIGFDEANLLTQEKGKMKQVKALGLARPIIVIGDGWSDYQIKEAGVADKFIAFSENIQRENVIEKADAVAKNFENVIMIIRDYRKSFKK